MLGKFIILAAAMQAGLAIAHIEDGKGRLGTPIKPDYTLNSTTGHHGYGHGHGHDYSHGHGHKSINNHEHGNGTHPDPHNSDHRIEARGVGGTVILANRCHYDIWVWSVSEGYSSPPIHVPARTRYSEPKRAPAAGGVVLKVSRSDQLVGGKQTQFEYAIADNKLYYDISFVDCAIGKSGSNCPGWHTGLSISSPNKKCKAANCPKGKYCPHNAYFVDTPVQKLGIPEPVFGCGDAGVGMDLWMRMCAKNKPMKRELEGQSLAGRIVVD